MENMDGIFPDMPEHVKRILTEVLDNGPRGQAPSHSKKMFELLESGREDITAQELREAVETTGVHFPVWDGALKLILERVCKKWGIELAWTATPDAPTAHGLMLSQREAEAFERTTGNTGMHWVQVGYDQMPMFIAALSVVFSLWSRTANPSNTAKIFEMIDNLALNGTITLMPKASGHVRVHVDSKAYECDPKSRELMLGLRTDQLEDQLTNPNAIRALIENHRDDPATIYKTLEASFMVWALNHAEVAEWVEAGQKQLQGASDDE